MIQNDGRVESSSNQRHRWLKGRLDTCPKSCLKRSDWRTCAKIPCRTKRQQGLYDYTFIISEGDDSPVLIVPASEGLLRRSPFDSVVSNTDPTYGTVVVSSNGSFTYVPPESPECDLIDEFSFIPANTAGPGESTRSTITMFPTKDETKPEVLCEKNVVARVGQLIPFIFKEASDECFGSGTGGVDQSPKRASEPGSILVTATVRDSYGNTGECATLVKVITGGKSACGEPGGSCVRTPCCKGSVCKRKGTNKKGQIVRECELKIKTRKCGRTGDNCVRNPCCNGFVCTYKGINEKDQMVKQCKRKRLTRPRGCRKSGGNCVRTKCCKGLACIERGTNEKGQVVKRCE